ncbi:hypothetical protein CFP56_033534 [Quercus suber]|uniref:Uncharacterized protein n=1 Tax=Quercus suber TaxID=58331 RepID=A0AAW0JFP1_QUESU
MLLQHFSACNGNELVVDMQMIGQLNRQQNFLSQQQNEKIPKPSFCRVYLFPGNELHKFDFPVQKIQYVLTRELPIQGTTSGSAKSVSSTTAGSAVNLLSHHSTQKVGDVVENPLIRLIVEKHSAYVEKPNL